MKKEIRDYFKKFGAVGGRAGTGKVKRRGDAAYYRALQKKGAAARKANSSKKTRAKTGRQEP